ncbi:MAG: hypothetical protein DSZ33_03990 [Gammaproteobacteria bacterium]|nr:MAG: hypothetical protein DSZ33_03990 [Gammaproteobacteria bacterium]
MGKRRFSINVFSDADNRILLLKRGFDTDIGPGLWGFCGGHIELGESPLQCAEREVREELGEHCHYRLIRELGPVSDTWYGGRFEIWLFHWRWQGGDIRLNHEHTEYAWVSSDQYRGYAVVDGVDEDLAWLEVWPVIVLNHEKLPPRLKL